MNGFARVAWYLGLGLAVMAAGVQPAFPRDRTPVKTLDEIDVIGFAPTPPLMILPIFDTDYMGGRGGPGGGSASSSITDNPRTRDGCSDGDPVYVSTGNKIEDFTLFTTSGEMPLSFSLRYSTFSQSGQMLQSSNIYRRWITNFDYHLAMDWYPWPSNGMVQNRPDGSAVHFAPTSNPNVWLPSEPSVAKLVHNSDGTYTLYDDNHTTQIYDSTNRLLSIKDESGIGWTFAYDPVFTHSISKITHTSGRYITLTWVLNVGLTSVTAPNGNVYSFTWKSVNGVGGHGQVISGRNLTSITYPGTPAEVISFDYTDANDPWLLTGVDYNGAAYSKTTYNGPGSYSKFASATYFADGSGQTSFVYASSAQGGVKATATNALGHVTDYSSDANANLLTVAGHAAANCAATLSSATYTATGLPHTTIDNNGITDTYSYATNGQLQAQTEASGTPVTRTTNYTWDANAQLNRPLSVTIPGEAKTSYTYNAQNRLASISRTNLASVGGVNQTLTTTYGYTLYSNGMVASVKVTKPSPGGSDHSTYFYDTQGNLISIVDGLGYTTTYSNYNALGEVGKVVGPNGDETDYAYDARGRLASKTTHPNGNTATWTYTYDGFGLLSKVSEPDGEITTWTRDAEKRVKTITHNDKDGASTESFA